MVSALLIAPVWPNQVSYGGHWWTFQSFPLSRTYTQLQQGRIILLEQFQAGKQYCTINSLHSAISMTHVEVDGIKVGQHLQVTRFLKGVFNSQPQAPKYTTTWDVDVVLTWDVDVVLRL